VSIRIATGGAVTEAVRRGLPRLVDERIASGITAQDAGLWGPASEARASASLGWTESVADSHELLPAVASLRAELQRGGAHRVVLVAPPITALAARALTATQGLALTTVPAEVEGIATALGGAPDAAVVVADPAGVQPAALLDEVVRAVRGAGVDPSRRVVVAAPAGSPLLDEAARAGVHPITAGAGIGDRFSALSAAVLVPAGLAGADVAEVLDEAESEELNLAIDDPANNGLRLGAAVGGAGLDHLAVVADGTHLVGVESWAGAVLSGAGLMPPADGPSVVLRLVGEARDADAGEGEVLLSGSLGEVLLVVQYATCAAGWLRGADPFGQERA